MATWLLRGQFRCVGNARRWLIRVVGIGVWLWGTAAGSLAAEPIRIGVTLGLTGVYQAPATMQKRGYRIWEKDVNERGGILGQPVEILILDDGSDKSRSVAIYEDLVTEQDIDLVFGPYSSQITLAVAPLLERYGYPTLTPGAAADRIWQQGYKNIFGLFIPASKYALEMVGLAVEHGLQRVAIVHADDEFSVEAGRGARRWAGVANLDVVMFEQFAKGRHDLRDLAEQARRTEPDLLVVAGHFDESVDMRRALRQIEWYPRAYFATIGPALQAYGEAMEQDAELTFAPSLWEPDERLDFPGSRQFIQEFRRAYNTLPSYHAADAYAAGQVLEAAINKAGSLDRNEIRRSLYDLDVHTAIGRFRVDQFGVPIKHRPLIIQWRNGQKVIVYPEEHRGDTEPVFAR